MFSGSQGSLVPDLYTVKTRGDLGPACAYFGLVIRNKPFLLLGWLLGDEVKRPQASVKTLWKGAWPSE